MKSSNQKNSHFLLLSRTTDGNYIFIGASLSDQVSPSFWSRVVPPGEIELGMDLINFLGTPPDYNNGRVYQDVKSLRDRLWSQGKVLPRHHIRGSRHLEKRFVITTYTGKRIEKVLVPYREIDALPLHRQVPSQLLEALEQVAIPFYVSSRKQTL